MSISPPARALHAPQRPVAASHLETPRATSPAPSCDDEPDWLECDQAALIQAQAQAWAHVLPALPPGPTPRVPVRAVTEGVFAELLQHEPFYAMARALLAEDRDPFARVARAARWLGGAVKRLFATARSPMLLPLPQRACEVAAYLPSRGEVVLCDDRSPNPHAWSAALRAPLAMAYLHQRAPEYLGALSAQWLTHVRYDAARLRLETSPELLLAEASRQNAHARWAWLSAYGVLAATSDLLQKDTAEWCRQVAATLRVPARLLRKLVQLHQQDPDMLLGTLQEPLRIDALARGALDTMVFVPFGQTEVTRHGLYEIDRRTAEGSPSLMDEEAPVVEFAPLRGMPLDVRHAPVGAALQLLENGFCPQAVRLLEETLELESDNIAALLSLAELYLQQARPEPARACYERVLTLRPEHRRALRGVQRVAHEGRLTPPDAAKLRGLDSLIPAQRMVLPRV